jgi:four helix bundle protein
MTTIHTYKELIVWQKAMDTIESVYRLTGKFPTDERYGLVSQMRRSAVSIASNIAEGRRRGTRRDFRQFLIVAYASGAELETQLEIARRLSIGEPSQRIEVEKVLEEVMKILNRMITSLHPSWSS